MHKIDIPSWALDQGRTRFDALDLRTTALLVIDLQDGFMVEGEMLANPHARDIVPNVNRLARFVREGGGTVVYTRHTTSDSERFRLADWQIPTMPKEANGDLMFRAGTPAHRLYGELEVKDGDIIVDKHRLSAFLRNSSDLDEILRERGIDTVIVTGTVTNACCESTARDGYMMGYKVVVVSDATAAVTDEEHNASLLSMARVIADIRTTEQVSALFARRSEAA